MTLTGDSADAPSLSRRLRLGLFLLSAAALSFEIQLTRLFSVAQFYHFAFMIISIALLGYGASGTVLAIFQGFGQKQPQRSLSRLALATAVSILGAYLLINRLPFDSFSIAWERKQVWILLLHYGALALPFFFAGMAVGLLLAAYPRHSSRTYAVNLLGAALGCLITLFLPSQIGGEGMVMLSTGMAALAAFVAAFGKTTKVSPPSSNAPGRRRLAQQALLLTSSSLLLCVALLDLGFRAAGHQGLRWLDLHLSPYKSLSYALQIPGAQLIYQGWNSFARVDLVRSPGIHSYPGLSYRYLKPLPEEDGLTIDGGDLSPIVHPTPDLEFTSYLPAAVAFHLRPQAEALVLEPRGGLDILVALAQGAHQVTAVEANPMIVSAAGDIYRDPRVNLEIESDRSFLRRTTRRFDVIVLSLTSSYHSVRSGAYSLMEDYRYTVEAFQDALFRLNSDGLLVVTRWLQTPPSECLRTFALAVTALESEQGDPGAQIIAFRSYNTATILVKKSAFTAGELQVIREFADKRAFDFNYAPGLLPDEINRHNILPEPIYYQAFTALLEAQPRNAFYASYPFDVTPPTDDRPFFGHYFKWSQAGQVAAELGKTWQPFGGAGYFVIIALLLLAVLLSGVLIILPAVLAGRAQVAAQPPPAYLIYFGLIGFAFMLVEIPLIQRFILYLGHPAYAMIAVLFTLLLFSALGSHFSKRFSLQPAIGFLFIFLLAMTWLLPLAFRLTLGLSLVYRLGVTAIFLAPAGFLMGVPFPGGIQRMLERNDLPSQVSWIWAVNGAASVVSSVLAALLALSFGLDWVLKLGAVCYAGAWIVLRAGLRQGPDSLPR